MKSAIKRVIIALTIILEITFFAALHTGLIPSPESHVIHSTEYPPRVPEKFYDVAALEIMYTAEYRQHPFVYRFYKIQNTKGAYYSNTGKTIDFSVIQYLMDSLTDLYESEYQKNYKEFYLGGYYPHFTVVITLTNGKDIIIKSDSNYYCFIPWNIEYDGNTYVQYNGRIPTALFRILQEIEPDTWSDYQKEAYWGCYPAELPAIYTDPSLLFPKTEPAAIPGEEQGKSCLLWEAALDPVMGSPCSHGGRVYVTVTDRLLSLDAPTGDVLWEFVFDEPGEILPFLHSTENILVHEGKVYCSAPDSWIYCLEGETGELLWKHKTGAQYIFSMHMFEDNLVSFTGGITCLNKETGHLIWEMTDNTWNEAFYHDKVLLEGIEEEGPYRALVDVNTGAVLWKENFFDATYPVYQNGVLYFCNPKENTLISIDIWTGEPYWYYVYGETVTGLTINKDRVILVLFNEKENLLDSVVVLDTKGSEIYTYTYPRKITWEFGYTVNCIPSEDTEALFLIREGGFIQAFKDGDNLWETEVRGTQITSFNIYEEEIYISDNDGKIYCLNLDTGKILWIFAAADKLTAFPDNIYVYVSSIEDGLLFVATSEGSLYALSI